jgi:hypothetical protein
MAELTRDLCRGCVDDFYNQGMNGMGGNGCWHFKTAKLVTRYRIGTWVQPTQSGAFTEVRVLNCRHENGEHFYDSLPDFVKREDVIRPKAKADA